MQLSKEYLSELARELCSYEDLHLVDIPDIDLYMDQVTTFIERKLGPLKREQNDKMLTKTMINNYTKDGILMTSKNKKYSRQHMVLLILIYNLKQVLSIKDISTLLRPLVKQLAGNGGSGILDQLYEEFLDLKQVDSDNCLDDNLFDKLELVNKQSLTQTEGNQEITEILLTVLLLVNQANLHKRLAERIIDDYISGK